MHQIIRAKAIKRNSSMGFPMRQLVACGSAVHTHKSSAPVYSLQWKPLQVINPHAYCKTKSAPVKTSHVKQLLGVATHNIPNKFVSRRENQKTELSGKSYLPKKIKFQLILKLNTTNALISISFSWVLVFQVNKMFNEILNIF